MFLFKSKKTKETSDGKKKRSFFASSKPASSPSLPKTSSTLGDLPPSSVSGGAKLKSYFTGSGSTPDVLTNKKSFGDALNGSRRDRGDSIFTLSSSEAAFLPRTVKRALAENDGNLPAAPNVFASTGAVLFVDISGFTALGARLRRTNSAGDAAARLARIITYVLAELTTVCLDFGGDVAKFAGDALMCCWEGDLEDSLASAKLCAVEMLLAMKKYNATSKSQLDVHGGIAQGSILNVHLGSSDDDLRWYLVAGEAVSGATSMVESAGPGEIIVMLEEAIGRKGSKSSILSVQSEASMVAKSSVGSGGSSIRENLASSVPQTKTSTTSSFKFKKTSLIEVSTSNGTLTGSPIGAKIARKSVLSADDEFSSTLAPYRTEEEKKRRASSLVQHNSPDRFAQSALSSAAAAHPQSPLHDSSLLDAVVEHDDDLDDMDDPVDVIDVSVLTSDTILVAKNDPRTRAENSVDDSWRKNGLPRTGNAYIPKALRTGLLTGHDIGEMRNRVAVVFVGLEDLALSEDELKAKSISESKLATLNAAFVECTRILHLFDGEVRDLLFDDKGCIFIGVFGAHEAVEYASLKAIKAALAIANEVAHAKIGISIGTCFVGTCGTRARHDFVVMGHEVNMSARYMVMAEPGDILASPSIYERTKDLIEYTSQDVFLDKHASEYLKNHPDERPEHDVQKMSKQSDASNTPTQTHFHRGRGETASTIGSDVPDSPKPSTLSKAYKPSKEIARRPSFLAEYRYGRADKDVFVGRTEELRRLETAMNQSASRRRVSVSVVEAEAGLGKTSLVTRMRKGAKGRMKIGHGVGIQLEDLAKEYFVLSQVLSKLVGFDADAGVEAHKAAVHEIDPDLLKDEFLYGLVLGTERPFGGKQPKKKITQKNAPSDVAAFFKRFLVAASKHTPLLIVVEDCQWCDSNSLHALDALLDFVDDMERVSFLFTLRPLKEPSSASESHGGSPGPSPRSSDLRVGTPTAGGGPRTGNNQTRQLIVANILSKARGAPIYTSIALETLSEKETALLVSKSFGAKSPDAISLGRVLFDRTGGNPMFLTLLIEWVKENELMLASDGEFKWNSQSKRGATPAEAEFPNSISDTIVARFDELDAGARSVLKIAAALGKRDQFNAILLTEVFNASHPSDEALDENVVLGDLNVGLAHSFLKHKKDATKKERGQNWRWTHDSISNAIYELIPNERRAELEEIVKETKKRLQKKTLNSLLAFSGIGDEDEDEDGTL